MRLPGYNRYTTIRLEAGAEVRQKSHTPLKTIQVPRTTQARKRACDRLSCGHLDSWGAWIQQSHKYPVRGRFRCATEIPFAPQDQS